MVGGGVKRHRFENLLLVGLRAWLMNLKGACHEIFDFRFYRDNDTGDK
jgi:hypothetical protein